MTMVDSNDTNDNADVSSTSTDCEACGESCATEYDTVDISDNEYRLCDGCIHTVIEDIEDYYWWDRLSEAQYNAAAEYLRSLDEVWCVKAHAYEAGEMGVHTPYCSSTIVADVCDHFGFEIRSFGTVYPTEHEFDCVHDHGPCVEIGLDYNSSCARPLPPEAHDHLYTGYREIEWLDEETKLFERSD